MDTCHQCGNQYKSLGGHWAKSDCDWEYPDSHVEDILLGVLLGDGCVARKPPSGNCRYVLTMRNLEFLEWLADEIGFMFSSITDKCSREGDYRLETMTHPWLSEVRERWYPDGRKRFPSDLELNKTRMKMWYVTDGTLGQPSVREVRPHIKIYNHDQHGQLEDVMESLDHDFGYVSVNKHCIRMGVNAAENFLEWLGEPVPGFEYKWDTNS